MLKPKIFLKNLQNVFKMLKAHIYLLYHFASAVEGALLTSSSCVYPFLLIITTYITIQLKFLERMCQHRQAIKTSNYP